MPRSEKYLTFFLLLIFCCCCFFRNFLYVMHNDAFDMLYIFSIYSLDTLLCKWIRFLQFRTTYTGNIIINNTQKMICVLHFKRFLFSLSSVFVKWRALLIFLKLTYSIYINVSTQSTHKSFIKWKFRIYVTKIIWNTNRSTKQNSIDLLQIDNKANF